MGVLRLVVADQDVFTQQALSERLGVLPSRLVVLLDELAEQGLVQRRPHPTDRRSNVLHATEEGRRRFGAAVAVAEALDEGLVRALDAAERAELLRLLGVVARSEELIAGVHPAYRQEQHE